MTTNSTIDTSKLLHLFEVAGEGMPSAQAQRAAEINAALSALILTIASEAIACMSANNGMPWNQSYALTAKVMAETSALLLEPNVHPAQIKDMLCQPDSLAIEAMGALEQVRLRMSMIDACNLVENQITANKEKQEKKP